MPLVHTVEKRVELLGAGGDGDKLLAALVELCRCGEAHGDELGCLLQQLVRLVLADTCECQIQLIENNTQ